MEEQTISGRFNVTQAADGTIAVVLKPLKDNFSKHALETIESFNGKSVDMRVRCYPDIDKATERDL